MSSNLYSVGLSGLLASNARINTTGQNTSNVDTEGYSRQRTDTTSSYLGGVTLRETSRLVDNFVSAQARTDISTFSYYDTYNAMMSVSDNLLAEDSISLTKYMNEAFGALQTASNDPTSSSLRELAYLSLNNLVEQYKTLSDVVGRQESLADEQLSSTLTDVNSITTQISELNSQIMRHEGLSRSPANELRDQQELLAKDLSQYLDIKIQFNDDGVMSVELKNGQPLVMDKNPTVLKMATDPLNPKNIELFMDFGDYEVGLKRERLGGDIGGLLDYRVQFSQHADRTLGQHAISIADAMNVQNAKGIDGNGDFGKDLFTLGEINIHSTPDNLHKISDISVRVTAGSSGKITKDSYQLEKTDDSRYMVTKYDLNGNAAGRPVMFDTSELTPNSNGYYTIEELGLDIRLSEGNEIDEDDVFHFVPTKSAATTLEFSAHNGDEIALSAPVGVSTHSDNLSDARMSLSEVTNTNPETSSFSGAGPLYPSAPHKIYFTSPTSFVVQDSSGTEIGNVKNVTHYTNLLKQAGLSEEAGFDVSISSKPKLGDVFTMGADEIGPADNFNGLELTNLQNKMLVAGEESLSKSFAGFVAFVGSKTAEIAGHAESSEIVMNESSARRDRLSAVSLDEEAVNLLKYQQSYSASAQVITAARTTFETLLGIMR
jgi:flagellar hook-associated protein 1 FlgK